MKEKPTCKTCVYFDPFITPDTISGLCRKRSPRAIVGHKLQVENFAVITDDDWCGEHPDFPAWVKKKKEADLAGKTISDNEKWKRAQDIATVLEAILMKESYGFGDNYKKIPFDERCKIMDQVSSDIYHDSALYHIIGHIPEGS